MDGLDDLTVDMTLLDSSAPDVIGALNFNSTGDFNAVMSLFSGMEGGNLSFDDFSNDTFWDSWGSNDSFGGFDGFLLDFFGFDGDEEPPNPDDEPPGDDEPNPFNDPYYEIIVNGVIIPQLDVGAWAWASFISSFFGGHATSAMGYASLMDTLSILDSGSEQSIFMDGIIEFTLDTLLDEALDLAMEEFQVSLNASIEAGLSISSATLSDIYDILNEIEANRESIEQLHEQLSAELAALQAELLLLQNAGNLTQSQLDVLQHQINANQRMQGILGLFGL